MRTRIILFVTLLLSYAGYTQDVHWNALTEDTRHLASAYFGADYSSYYGLSYGYVLKNKFRPAAIGTELTIPFGKDMLDDWRWKTSVQAELWKKKNFSFSVKPSYVLKRYDSPLARMYASGADLTLLFGYLKPKWGITALANYDKIFATHIKHDLMKTYYPEIRDGWYNGSGGNFKFGARASLSVNSWNTFLSMGKHYGQNFKDNPTLPFFAEFSVQKQF